MTTLVWDVDPVLLRAGGFSLRYYSACFVAAIIGCYLVLSRELRRAGADVEEAGDFVSYGLLGTLIGARLGHVLFYDLDRAVADPAWVLQIWKGGLSSHGATLGLLGAMWLFTRRRAIALVEGTDRLVPCVPLMVVLLRTGNFFNSEIVGKPTDGTWGVLFPRYDDYGEAIARHPTQLYEIALGLALLLLLRFMDGRWGGERRPRGALTGLFLVAYFSGRFLVEFWKMPEGTLWLLSTPQWLSLPGVVAGTALLHRAFRTRAVAGWRVGSA